MQKPGLGRGLSALLGDGPLGGNYTQPNTNAIVMLGLDQIIPNPEQPRRGFDEAALEELSQSLKAKGILQPLIVRTSQTQTGKFEIIAGERRWRAAQRVPLHEIPVIVRSSDDKETLELALIENIQRQDLNPIEEAEGYKRLIEEYGYSQEKIGQFVGKSRSHIANLLRLLELPLSVRLLIADNKLTMGHARALITTDNPLFLAEEIISQGLSVRQAEKIASQHKKEISWKKVQKSNSIQKNADILALEQDLSDFIGLKVAIQDQGGNGLVSITYQNLDQLDELCERLTRQKS